MTTPRGPIRVLLNERQEWLDLWDPAGALFNSIGQRASVRFSKLSEDDWTTILLMLYRGVKSAGGTRRQEWNPRKPEKLTWTQIGAVVEALRRGEPALASVQDFVRDGLEAMYEEALSPSRSDVLWAFKMATDEFLDGGFQFDDELIELLMDAYAGSREQVLKALFQEKFPYLLHKPTLRVEYDPDRETHTLVLDVFDMIPVSVALRHLPEGYDEAEVRRYIYDEFSKLSDWYAKTVIRKLENILAEEDAENRVDWNRFWTSYVGTQDVAPLIGEISAFLARAQPPSQGSAEAV